MKTTKREKYQEEKLYFQGAFLFTLALSSLLLGYVWVLRIQIQKHISCLLSLFYSLSQVRVSYVYQTQGFA